MLKSILFLIIIFPLNACFAQVDSLNKKLKFVGDISFGGAYQTGGLRLFTIKSASNVHINFNNISSDTYLQYAFNKTFNKIIQNDFFGYEIISLWKKKRLHFKIAGMYEKSKIKSIDNHFFIGLGMGWNVLTKTKYKLVFINAFAFEKNEFLVNELLDYQGIRYSIILKGDYTLLNNKLIIKHKFFINPFLFNSKNNYRYRFLIDLLMPISKRISSKVSFDYSNERIIDTGFKPENTLITFGLTYKL